MSIAFHKTNRIRVIGLSAGVLILANGLGRSLGVVTGDVTVTASSLWQAYKPTKAMKKTTKNLFLLI